MMQRNDEQTRAEAGREVEYYSVVMGGGQQRRWADPQEAGRAYCDAPAGALPWVAIDARPVESGLLRAASTRIVGQYKDGSLRAVKDLPAEQLPWAPAFRAGYTQRLAERLDTQLQAVDWQAVRPAHASHTPALGERFYDQLEQLSKLDFNAAARVWRERCPREYAAPAFVDPAWRSQTQGLARISQAFAVMSSKDATPVQRAQAGGAIAHAAGLQASANPVVRQRVAQAVATQLAARTAAEREAATRQVQQGAGRRR